LSVAIVGGPIGLTLSFISQRSDTDLSVFEREASEDERSRGGALDLHHAMTEMRQGFKTRQGKCISISNNLSSEDDPRTRQEIDRGDLRAIILESITNDSKDTFGLVVGADGSWSVVRPLLTPNQPVLQCTPALVLLMLPLAAQTLTIVSHLCLPLQNSIRPSHLLIYLPPSKSVMEQSVQADQGSRAGFVQR
jgi:hypothetical protein